MSENQTPRQILSGLLNVSFGLILFGTGTHLTIQSNLGPSPWDVFYIGVSKQTGLTYGNVFALFSLCVIVIDGIILKEKIGFGMFCSAILIGKTVDILSALNLLPTMQGSIFVRILVLLLGYWLEGFSQFFYMRAGLGFGAIDALQVGLSRRMPLLPIGAVNAILLGGAFVVGVLLGEPVGFATVAAPFAISALQQITFSMMHFDPKKVRSQPILESLRILLSCCRTQHPGKTG